MQLIDLQLVLSKWATLPCVSEWSLVTTFYTVHI